MSLEKSNCKQLDGAAPSVARVGARCAVQGTRHFPLSCAISGAKDGGFNGYILELHHRQAPKRHALHNFC